MSTETISQIETTLPAEQETTIPETTVETVLTVAAEEAYQGITAEYKEVMGVDSTAFLTAPDSYFNGDHAAVRYYHMYHGDNFYYAYTDIDGNGMEELLIGFGREGYIEITVKITLDEEKAKEYGYSFTGLEKKFTVEGLTEPIEIDPFAEDVCGSGKIVDATLEGIDPFVCLYLRNNAELSDPIRHITYKADKDWNLKNGEVITITATMDEKFQQ